MSFSRDLGHGIQGSLRLKGNYLGYPHTSSHGIPKRVPAAHGELVNSLLKSCERVTRRFGKQRRRDNCRVVSMIRRGSAGHCSIMQIRLGLKVGHCD